MCHYEWSLRFTNSRYKEATYLTLILLCCNVFHPFAIISLDRYQIICLLSRKTRQLFEIPVMGVIIAKILTFYLF